MPEGRGAATLADALLEQGYLTAPGHVFGYSDSTAPYFRFNVATTQDSPALAALAKLMGA